MMPSQIAFSAVVDNNLGATKREFFSGVYLVNTDGSQLKRIDHLIGKTPEPVQYLGGLTWNSLQQCVTYKIEEIASGDQEIIYCYSLKDGTNNKQTQARQKTDLNAVYSSPDKKYIAASRQDDSEPGLVLMPQDGSPERLVADKLSNIGQTGWSPDSKFLVIQASDEDDYDNDLWLLDVATGKLTMAATRVGFEPVWTWSPDSTLLVTVSATEDADGWQFSLLDSGCVKKTLLHTQQGSTEFLHAMKPSWSADSRFLAISSMISEDDMQYLINIYDRDCNFYQTLQWPDEHFSLISDVVFLSP
jgi:Tol biopolymer transport system component